jgi:hypothetical protein
VPHDNLAVFAVGMAGIVVNARQGIAENGEGFLVRISPKAITLFGDGDRSSERSDERLSVVQPPWHIVPAS